MNSTNETRVVGAVENVIEQLASDISLDFPFDSSDTLHHWEILVGFVGWQKAYVELIAELVKQEAVISKTIGFCFPDGGWTAACLANFAKMMEETGDSGEDLDPHAAEYVVSRDIFNDAAETERMIQDVKATFHPDKVMISEEEHVTFFFDDGLCDEESKNLADCVEELHWKRENF